MGNTSRAALSGDQGSTGLSVCIIQSALESLILASWPAVGGAEALGRPTTIDEYVRVELIDVHLREADVTPGA